MILSIVETAKDRREVYETADFVESYLAKLVNHPRPPGKSVLKRLVRAYPARGGDLVRAWFADRCDMLRAEVEKIVPGAIAVASEGDAVNAHDDTIARVRSALIDGGPGEWARPFVEALVAAARTEKGMRELAGQPRPLSDRPDGASIGA